jgi:hypothetical protein
MAERKPSGKKSPAKKTAVRHTPFKAGSHILPDGAEWEIKEGKIRKNPGNGISITGKSGSPIKKSIRHECESVCVKTDEDGNCLKWQTICQTVT